MKATVWIGVGLRSALAASLLLSGCVSWSDPEIELTTRVVRHQPRLRHGSIPGEVAVDADGRLTFSVEAAKLCEKREETFESGTETSRLQTNVLVGVGLAAGLGALIGGIAVHSPGPEGESPNFDGRPLSVVGGVILVVTGFQVVYAANRSRTVELEVTSTDRVVTLPCEGDLPRLFGALTVTTPWGATTRAPTYSSGSRFSIDWSATGIEPSGAQARTQVLGPWRVSSSIQGSLGTWQLAPADVDRALTWIATGAPAPE